MKQRLAIFLLTVIIALSAQAQAQREYIILMGGPSRHEWEQYKSQPHDHWWANFVHAARVRMGEPATLRFHYVMDEPLPKPVFGFGLHRIDGVHATGLNSRETFVPDQGFSCFS